MGQPKLLLFWAFRRAWSMGDIGVRAKPYFVLHRCTWGREAAGGLFLIQVHFWSLGKMTRLECHLGVPQSRNCGLWLWRCGLVTSSLLRIWSLLYTAEELHDTPFLEHAPLSRWLSELSYLSQAEWLRSLPFVWHHASPLCLLLFIHQQ